VGVGTHSVTYGGRRIEGGELVVRGGGRRRHRGPKVVSTDSEGDAPFGRSQLEGEVAGEEQAQLG
jgi:hypothetical protein